MIKISQVEHQLYNQVWNQVMDYESGQVLNHVQVRYESGQVLNHVLNHVGDQVRYQVRDQSLLEG